MPQIGACVFITGEAGETLTGKKFYCVTLESDEQYDLGDSAGTDVTGILASGDTQDDTIVVDDTIEVAMQGRYSVVAGAAFDAGVLLQDSGAGKAIVAATGDYAFGRALKSATADEQIIPVWLFGGPVMVN